MHPRPHSGFMLRLVDVFGDMGGQRQASRQQSSNEIKNTAVQLDS